MLLKDYSAGSGKQQEEIPYRWVQETVAVSKTEG